MEAGGSAYGGAPAAETFLVRLTQPAWSSRNRGTFSREYFILSQLGDSYFITRAS
ncbi:MAG TPA: hypothetical protein VHU19_06305 [Pyrinomonadaceae bacterium]|nr:hypothetical protein [Pyrinomonadaceae bacterium]